METRSMINPYARLSSVSLVGLHATDTSRSGDTESEWIGLRDAGRIIRQHGITFRGDGGAKGFATRHGVPIKRATCRDHSDRDNRLRMIHKPSLMAALEAQADLPTIAPPEVEKPLESQPEASQGRLEQIERKLDQIAAQIETMALDVRTRLSRLDTKVIVISEHLRRPPSEEVAVYHDLTALGKPLGWKPDFMNRCLMAMDFETCDRRSNGSIRGYILTDKGLPYGKTQVELGELNSVSVPSYLRHHVKWRQEVVPLIEAYLKSQS